MADLPPGIPGLVIGWQTTPQLDLRLNVNNLLDRTCYNALSGTATFPAMSMASRAK
ncbi:hypothetical protein [Comamonas koreensis]|uniref:TonB-dependent receptor n=1 Tax=Comamonas koreensis TaxID=160825 RepID=A0AAW4XRZ0_9BURK|nr:hypothetical protein [Comamonas koreensis]MCD2164125.1 hypothetical protein [Comamonas koreensis]